MRVLLIDDNPDDRELARRELSQEFPAAEFIEVADESEFKRTLQQQGFDLVITDYHLRWSTGLQVLRHIRSKSPHIPIVMFTATASQDEAVAAMVEGLDDYVTKSPRNYVRLRTAGRAVIERAATRRRAAELERRLQSLLERLHVGVFRATLYGRLLDCNRSLRRFISENGEAEAESQLQASSQTPRPTAGAEGETESLMEQLSRSPHFRELLWTGGQPGALDLLRQAGDESVREVRIRKSENQCLHLMVRLAYTRIDDQIVIDGLVDDITHLRRS